MKTGWVFGALSLGGVLLGIAAQGCGKPGVDDYCRRECECLTDGPCDSYEDWADCATYRNGLKGGAYLSNCVPQFEDMVVCWYEADDCPATDATCPEELKVYEECLHRDDP